MKKVYFDGWVWEVVCEYAPNHNGLIFDVDSCDLRRKVNGKWLYIDKVKMKKCYFMREEG